MASLARLSQLIEKLAREMPVALSQEAGLVAELLVGEVAAVTGKVAAAEVDRALDQNEGPLLCSRLVSLLLPRSWDPRVNKDSALLLQPGSYAEVLPALLRWAVSAGSAQKVL